MSSTRKGATFERYILTALNGLSNKHFGRVRVSEKPRITLYDGQDVIPDFDLQIDLPFAECRYLIECQNRKRSKSSILHKIKYVKGLSRRNKFLFVYRSKIPIATCRGLESDGIICLSLEEFITYIAKIQATLDAIGNVDDKANRHAFDELAKLLPDPKGVHFRSSSVICECGLRPSSKTKQSILLDELEDVPLKNITNKTGKEVDEESDNDEDADGSA